MAGSFALDLTRMCQKADLDVKTAVRKFAFTGFSKVALKNPVKFGISRANWNVSIGKMDTSVDMNASDLTGESSIAKINAVTSQWDGQGSIFYCNSTAYIIPLEYGHSKQAPNGMVRVTVEEMQRWANK